VAGPKPIPPTVTEEVGYGGTTRQELNHPAFGNIMVTKPQGNIGVLHGSELRHSSCVKITISNAKLVRDLSTDWHHSTDTIVEVEMSEAQWATFISSMGYGGGVPCTLVHKPEDGFKLQWVPSIERVETSHEKFSREMRRAVHERQQAVKDGVKRLRTLLETGKPSIKELREILKALENNLDGMPGTAAFVMDCFQEVVEKETEAAKVEIEAFVTNMAMRTGIKALADGHMNLLPGPAKKEGEK
jgi:hypothetical protein